MQAECCDEFDQLASRERLPLVLVSFVQEVCGKYA